MNTTLRSVCVRTVIGLTCAIFSLTAPASATWIAVHDFNGWWTDDTKNGASLKAKEVAEQKAKLSAVAFAPSGDWVVLFGGNGYWTSNVNLPACKKLTELQSGSHTFKCVAFAPNGGWVVFYDQNGYAFENIPAEAQKAIEQVVSSGGALKWLSFTSGGGWCLLHGKNGYMAHGAPEDFLQRIKEVTGQGSTLETVSFTGAKGWVFFFDKGGFYAGNIPEDAFKRLVELQKTGVPRTIAFTYGAKFDPKATYVLEEKPAQHIHATLSTDIALANGQADEWFLYAPEFPNLPSQREMKTAFEPQAQIVRDQSALQRPVFLSQVANHRKDVHTVLTIDGTLYSRNLRVVAAGDTVPAVQDLTPDQARHFTRVSPTSDIESKTFRDWMQRNGLTRGANESELVFAHRTFAFIVHHYTYEWPTETRTASQVCAAGRTDCGGLSSLFTGVMRANGIPARMLGGRWASSQKPGDKAGDYGKWHVKAEFFAHGVGWVPVDGSSALADPNGENDFFGHDHGDHVAFVLDEDLVVNSFIEGPQKLWLMQGIVYWWRGRGNGNGTRVDELWTVQQQKL